MGVYWNGWDALRNRMKLVFFAAPVRKTGLLLFESSTNLGRKPKAKVKKAKSKNGTLPQTTWGQTKDLNTRQTTLRSNFVLDSIFQLYHYEYPKLIGGPTSVGELFISLVYLEQSRIFSKQIPKAVCLPTQFLSSADLPDRSTPQPLLPMSTREKDSKNREELDKFLNGNSANITT
ncbi:hypothetical protein DVH24_033006 [Malus domestica]|uniref:Uncharacterized protein n=1 Tax=Malus domestica TaxID=3750 RepID=A0A498IS38_MALDO|nr:hypothetical protein DVH24_033006 [Malus domestica]